MHTLNSLKTLTSKLKLLRGSMEHIFHIHSDAYIPLAARQLLVSAFGNGVCAGVHHDKEKFNWSIDAFDQGGSPDRLGHVSWNHTEFSKVANALDICWVINEHLDGSCTAEHSAL